jgi:hypothetical protein
MNMNELINFLNQADIFYQFTPTQLEMVANLLQPAGRPKRTPGYWSSPAKN